MFARVHTLCLTLVFALCASAASVSVRHDGEPVHSGEPVHNGAPVSSNSCNANTGTQQCCNSLAKASDSVVTELVALLGIVLEPIDALVGLTCTPIVGTTQCNTQAACCTGNTFGGLITIGCSPINISL